METFCSDIPYQERMLIIETARSVVETQHGRVPTPYLWKRAIDDIVPVFIVRDSILRPKGRLAGGPRRLSPAVRWTYDFTSPDLHEAALVIDITFPQPGYGDRLRVGFDLTDPLQVEALRYAAVVGMIGFIYPDDPEKDSPPLVTIDPRRDEGLLEALVVLVERYPAARLPQE